MKWLLSFIILVFNVYCLFSQDCSTGNRFYEISIDTYNLSDKFDRGELIRFNDVIEENYKKLSGDKRLFGTTLNAYRTAFSSKVITTVDKLIDVGADYISNSVKSHKDDWRKAVMQECTFTKNLQMGQDASDFYGKISNVGALDLRGIAFKGFSCSHKMRNGKDTIDVFYMSFKLDTSKAGVERMFMHSKFQMTVDSIMFNPWVCELPNDSIQDIGERVGFDFKRRKNLTVRLITKIKSSWVNEAIQVVSDKEIGKFVLEMKIDSLNLDNDTGVFTYSNKHSRNSDAIEFTGESFIVPRSYIGIMQNHDNIESCWGTGQYKLEMQLMETCQINESYYLKKCTDTQKHKLNSEWRKEWKIIKRRISAREKTPWEEYKDEMISEYKNGKWVTTIVTPLKNILTTGNDGYAKGGMQVNANYSAYDKEVFDRDKKIRVE